MKFDKAKTPSNINLFLPENHPGNIRILGGKAAKETNIFVGCAKLNKKDLKGLYPRGTKDELIDYVTQFNSIELNATFNKKFPANTVENWYQKTGIDFKFFSKVPQIISQFRRLVNCTAEQSAYLDSIAPLKEKLGMIFLQMDSNFAPNSFEALQTFVENWPKDFPLAVELRHTDWFNSGAEIELYALFEKHKIANVIVDTVDRRDLLHMKLTTKDAFIRYIGSKHKSDYTRLDQWVNRLEIWLKQGLENVYFFVHQNHEQSAPLLSKYFIEQLNARLSVNLKVPQLPDNEQNLTLF